MNYSIDELAVNYGISPDDIRMLFADVRGDWDTFKELNQAEYELVEKSLNAANQLALAPGNNEENTEITPSDTTQITLENQEKVVLAASQILGQKLTLAVEREIALSDALNSIKNQVIVSNTINSQRQLAQELEEIRRATEGNYLSVITSLSQRLAPEIEVDTASDDPLAEVAKIQASVGKRFVK